MPSPVISLNQFRELPADGKEALRIQGTGQNASIEVGKAQRADHALQEQRGVLEMLKQSVIQDARFRGADAHFINRAFTAMQGKLNTSMGGNIAGEAKAVITGNAIKGLLTELDKHVADSYLTNKVCSTMHDFVTQEMAAQPGFEMGFEEAARDFLHAKALTGEPANLDLAVCAKEFAAQVHKKIAFLDEVREKCSAAQMQALEQLVRKPLGLTEFCLHATRVARLQSSPYSETTKTDILKVMLDDKDKPIDGTHFLRLMQTAEREHTFMNHQEHPEISMDSHLWLEANKDALPHFGDKSRAMDLLALIDRSTLDDGEKDELRLTLVKNNKLNEAGLPHDLHMPLKEAALTQALESIAVGPPALLRNAGLAVPAQNMPHLQELLEDALTPLINDPAVNIEQFQAKAEECHRLAYVFAKNTITDTDMITTVTLTDRPDLRALFSEVVRPNSAAGHTAAKVLPLARALFQEYEKLDPRLRSCLSLKNFDPLYNRLPRDTSGLEIRIEQAQRLREMHKHIHAQRVKYLIDMSYAYNTQPNGAARALDYAKRLESSGLWGSNLDSAYKDTFKSLQPNTTGVREFEGDEEIINKEYGLASLEQFETILSNALEKQKNEKAVAPKGHGIASVAEFEAIIRNAFRRHVAEE